MTGAKIRARRKLLGFTQPELGKLAGASGNTITRWEAEKPACPYPLMLDALFERLETKAEREAEPLIEQLARALELLQEILERLREGE